MTVDSKGYVWTCSSNASRFDPMTETWQVVPVGGSGGCMEDGKPARST
jgi:streptogramin lyase